MDKATTSSPMLLLPPASGRRIRELVDEWDQIPQGEEMAKVLSKSCDPTGQLSLEQIRYAAYLAVPRKNRPLKRDIAKELGVCVRTLAYWKKEPFLQETILKISLNYASRDLPDILYAVVEKAKSGEVGSAKLALELFGLIGPNRSKSLFPFNTTSNKQKSTITKEELDICLASLRKT